MVRPKMIRSCGPVKKGNDTHDEKPLVVLAPMLPVLLCALAMKEGNAAVKNQPLNVYSIMPEKYATVIFDEFTKARHGH